MGTSLDIAKAVQSAAAERGVRFDDLKHAQQLRVADRMGLALPDLNRALAQLADASTAPAVRRGQNVIYDVHRGIIGSVPKSPKSQRDAELDAATLEMLRDPQSAVWAVTLSIESRLGLKPKGSQVERYERVQNRLAKLRKRSLTGKLTEREDQLIDRYRARMKAATDAHFCRVNAEAEALSSVARQARAIARANAMAAVR